MHLIAAEQLFGFLRYLAGLRRQKLGTYGRVQDILQRIRRLPEFSFGFGYHPANNGFGSEAFTPYWAR